MDVELSPDSQRNTSDSAIVTGIANPRTIPCDDPEDLSSEIDAASHHQVGPMGAADKNEGLCSQTCLVRWSSATPTELVSTDPE